MKNYNEVISCRCKDYRCDCKKFVSYMACHRRPDRSFTFRGKQFPVCARCTGVIIGQSIAIIVGLARIRISVLINIILLGLMFIDWLIQKIKLCESTNIRRLITGTMGGFGYVSILVEIIYYLIELCDL